MSPASDTSLLQIAGAVGLVLLALVVSRWQHAELERDIAIAAVRAFVQLSAIGYVIQLIFDVDQLAAVIALLAVMVVFGSYTARQRARTVPGAFGVLLVALGLSAVATLVLTIALGVFDASARVLVPLGGMVIGNAITAAAVTLNRLGEEITAGRRQIEATLALGATSWQAAAPIVRRSLRSGLIPLVDSTKTTGLIFFPGTMVGMLLAGADPLDAVRLQLILLYLLFGAVAVSGVTVAMLAYRRFFTAAHQLRH